MLDFLQNIFSKVISLMASVIVAVGLVSVPEIPEQPLLSEQPTIEIIEKQKNIEKKILDEEIEELNQEIQDLKNQKIREQNKQIEEDKRILAEEARKQAEAEEARRQEELREQAELEKKIAEKYEAQRKAEEEQAQQEHETQTTQKIKSDISYFSDLISSVNQNIEQTASAYRAGLDRERINYLNQTDSYTSIYKPSLTKRHREILNEASKGIWTDCGWLRDLWDYQDGDYQRYSTSLNNAERTFNSNVDFVASSYIPNFNLYLGQINREQSIHIPTKAKLNQYLNQLNGLSISGIETFKNEVSNLISELNSLESKINNAKSYSVSYPLPFSILLETDSLIREEKAWLTETGCKNLP